MSLSPSLSLSLSFSFLLSLFRRKSVSRGYSISIIRYTSNLARMELCLRSACTRDSVPALAQSPYDKSSLTRFQFPRNMYNHCIQYAPAYTAAYQP